MRPRRPLARGRGFTLFELIVVICLVAVLAAVLLDRLLRYQEIAEKTAMESTIGALRSAQALQLSARILHGGLPAAAALAEENPIDWLAAPPSGYLGGLWDASSVPPGSWYFDMKNKELVYRPQRTRFFHPGPDGGDRIRFEVVVRIVQPAPGGFRPAEVSELTIRPLTSINWSPEF